MITEHGTIADRIEKMLDARGDYSWEAELQMRLAENARLAGDTLYEKEFLRRATDAQNSGRELHRQVERLLSRLINPVWEVDMAEYRGEGYWADYPPLEFDSEKAANDHVALLNANNQCMCGAIGSIKVREIRRVY